MSRKHDDYEYLLNEAEIEPDIKRKAPENPGVPPELLLPGEIVIILLKPSMWYIILSSLRELTIVGSMYLVAWYLVQKELLTVSMKEVNTVAGLILGAILLYAFIDWVARLYVMTDQRIIRVKGIFKVDVYTARLSRIQSLQMFFTVRERIFGIGTIGFSTAGDEGIEAYWLMIPRPLRHYEKIERAIERYT